jgi:hypothetical protein
MSSFNENKYNEFHILYEKYIKNTINQEELWNLMDGSLWGIQPEITNQLNDTIQRQYTYPKIINNNKIKLDYMKREKDILDYIKSQKYKENEEFIKLYNEYIKNEPYELYSLHCEYSTCGIIEMSLNKLVLLCVDFENTDICLNNVYSITELINNKYFKFNDSINNLIAF